MHATPEIGNGGVSGVFGVFLVEVSVARSFHSSGLKTTGTPQGRRFIRPSAAAFRHRHTRWSTLHHSTGPSFVQHRIPHHLPQATSATDRVSIHQQV